jgi:alpha-beta hydrolase superfamily lysophospholipase
MPGYEAYPGTAEALYFDSRGYQLFGWLHRPANEIQGRIGLVVCKPFGYEAICSHRSLRTFAETAADIGIPALRFDYVATGDSADIDPQADQLEAWSRDIATAAIELQKRTGVERIYLLGFRLGALLAAMAASECEAVAGLILVAPVVSGPRYLREMRTTRLAASLGASGDSVGTLAPNGLSGTGGSMEVSGFSFAAATLAHLAQTELTKLGMRPSLEILVMDGKGLSVARDWINGLSANGMRVEHQTLPGTVEMLMTDPQFAVVPEPMVAAMREWLLRIQPQPAATRHETDARTPDRGPVLPTPVLRLAGNDLRHVVSERPVFLTSQTILFGVVTEPREGDKRRRGVILLNVGAEHHIGASRMYVTLARHWARHGYTVLRLDLAGIGDSGTRPGRPHNEVFPPAAIDDIRVAVEYMRSRYSIGDITLGGLCSGAYHALRAALVVPSVDRILLVNPMNYVWSESLSAEDLQLEVDVARNVKFYRDRMLSAAIWRRVFSGRLSIWRIVRIVMHRPLLNLRSRIYDCARSLRMHIPGDLGWELEELAARGVKMIFVFARGEPGIDLLKLQAGSSIKRLGAHCLIHVIDSADHIFSHGPMRNLLERVLSDGLFARTSRDGGNGCAELKRNS